MPFNLNSIEASCLRRDITCFFFQAVVSLPTNCGNNLQQLYNLLQSNEVLPLIFDKFSHLFEHIDNYDAIIKSLDIILNSHYFFTKELDRLNSLLNIEPSK